MPAANVVGTLAPTWTLDEVLEVLGKLPTQDLERFLARVGFPAEQLKGLPQTSLLEIAFGFASTWESEAPSYNEFLIGFTSSLCRASFEAFVRLLWEEVPGATPLKWNWHMGFLCGEGQRICERVFEGLPKLYDEVVNISPGTSKSTIFSIMLPAWVWTRMPQARIISASHTDSLVLDLATKTRSLMCNPRYVILFPEIEFTEEQNAKGHYRNTHGGERKISTIAGVSPLGFHAHLIIVDDPIHPKQVLSEVSKKTARDFFDVLKSRKVDKKVTPTFLIMQRLGVGDPTDVLLENAKREGAAQVRHVCLPAEITEDISPPELKKYYEEYNKDADCAPKGLMDPIRLDKIVLADFKTNAWVYAGQFLQKPVPPGGGIFKEEYFTNLERAAPYNCRRVRVWDRASTLDGGCFTAGVLMGIDADGGLWVEDCVHGQWDPVQRNKIMLATAQRDRRQYGKHEPAIWVEMEGGSSGRDAWLGIVRALQGFPVKELNVQQMGNKDMRAEPWATQLAGGNVRLIDNGHWDINGYIEEHCRFRPDPTKRKRVGGHCDRVDASAEAMALLVKMKRVNSPLRTIALYGKKNTGRWLAVCSMEDLPALEIDGNPTLFIFLKDPLPQPTIIQGEVANPENTPKEVMCNGPIELSSQFRGAGHIAMGAAGGDSSLPAGGMSAGIYEANGRQLLPPLLELKLPAHMGLLELNFADLDPADWQEHWGEEIEPWGMKPEDLQMSRDQAKKLWSFLMKSYPKPWQVVVLVDNGGEDARALSMAMGIADQLRIPRSAIYLPGDGEAVSEKEVPGNAYIYDLTKLSRGLVAV